MRNVIFVIVLLHTLFTSLPIHAAHDEHERLVARVMELDGTDRVFDTLPMVLDTIASQRQLVSLHSADEAQLYTAIKETLELTSAKKALRDHIVKNVDDETLTTVLAWLETPLGKKIAREEINTAAEQDQTAILRYLAGLQNTPLPRERIELIHRFVAQGKMAEVLAHITDNVTVAMINGLRRN